jgi:acetolactate synthase-1/2/3 large subunit
MHTAAFGRATGHELNNPDFAKLAEAFGVRSARISTPAELEAVLPRAISSREPWLIEAQVGDMASPWHLVGLHDTRPRRGHEAPPNPLGEPPTH